MGSLIQIECVHCGGELSIAAVHAGKTVSCPSCGRKTEVPAAAAATARSDATIPNHTRDSLKKKGEVVEPKIKCGRCKQLFHPEAGAGAIVKCPNCGVRQEVPELLVDEVTVDHQLLNSVRRMHNQLVAQKRRIANIERNLDKITIGVWLATIVLIVIALQGC